MVTCGKPDQDLLIGSEEHAGAITRCHPCSLQAHAATHPPRVQPNNPNSSIHYVSYTYYVCIVQLRTCTPHQHWHLQVHRPPQQQAVP
jgi:hypothetical protein